MVGKATTDSNVANRQRRRDAPISRVESVGYNPTQQRKTRRELLERTERKTGIEPATFSLGRHLSDEFYREILSHPTPTDLEAAKAQSSSPAALDLFMWPWYPCLAAHGKERVPLFGAFGLVSQLGSTEYARPRKFREKPESRLGLVRVMWPTCPAIIDRDGTGPMLDHKLAVVPSAQGQVLGKTRSSENRVDGQSSRRMR